MTAHKQKQTCECRYGLFLICVLNSVEVQVKLCHMHFHHSICMKIGRTTHSSKLGKLECNSFKQCECGKKECLLRWTLQYAHIVSFIWHTGMHSLLGCHDGRASFHGAKHEKSLVFLIVWNSFYKRVALSSLAPGLDDPGISIIERYMLRLPSPRQ